MSSVIEKADALYKERNFEELYTYLVGVVSDNKDNSEVLWRTARACHDAGEALHDPSKREDQKAKFLAGLDYAKQAVEVDSSNWAAHKWKGIATSDTSRYLPTKEKIKSAYEIRECFDKAMELNPEDPTIYHCIGAWCLEVAGLSWLERKAAQVFFAKPPESSYDEALKFFHDCETRDPTFKVNRLRIAQTYARKKEWKAAKEWAEKCLETEDLVPADVPATAEAEELLKKC